MDRNRALDGARASSPPVTKVHTVCSAGKMPALHFFLFLIITLLPISVFAAVWYDEYDAGVKAIAARDWSSAEARLKTALALQPKQGRQVRAYGIRFIRYIPDYYLGVAYFNQGKYQDALNQLQRIQKTGLVAQGDPEFPELSRLIQLAGEKLKPKTEEKKAPVTLPAPSPEAPKVKDQEAELKAQKLEEEKRKQEQFENLIKKAGDALAAKNFKQSRELAKQAAAMGVDETKSSELFHEIDLAETLDSLAKAVNKKDWVAAQKAAQQVASLDPGNNELMLSQPLIEQGLSEMKTQDLEDRGLLAFLSGDYQQAVALLERVIVVKKDLAETWFYLGCSHAGIGLLQAKEELLQQAQREFAQARKLDPKLHYSPGFISHRILELYEQAQ